MKLRYEELEPVRDQLKLTLNDIELYKKKKSDHQLRLQRELSRLKVQHTQLLNSLSEQDSLWITY